MQNEVYDDPDDMLYQPFKYRHMGSLAYIGNSAVFDIGNNINFAGGLVAMCALLRRLGPRRMPADPIARFPSHRPLAQCL